MSDLAAFLLARTSDDEAPTWKLVPYSCPPGCCAPAGYVGHECLICEEETFGGTVEAITGIAQAHDERIHHRARVLADCAARRKLIELHSEDGAECEIGLSGGVDVPGPPCLTLRILAEPFKDHPEFDEGWLV